MSDVEDMPGRTMEVVLSEGLDGVVARLEVGKAEVRTEAFCDDEDATPAFIEATRDLRQALALLGMVGSIELSRMQMISEGKDEAASRAISSFTEEDLTITRADVVSKREEEADASRRTGEFFHNLAEFVRQQQSGGAEDLTLGEALQRHRQGTEWMESLDDTQGDES